VMFYLSLFNAQSQSRPNIVFIMADDLGWGDLSCYGQDRYKTPHLDALAKDGVLFTNFYVSSPVCSPSRAGIMTGQFPARNRIFGHIATETKNKERGMPNFLEPSAPMITRLFKENGYTIGHFGKWHLGVGTDAPMPDIYGIDEHVTFASNDPRSQTDFNLDDPELRHVDSKLVFDEAIDFMETHKDKSFFMNVWLYDVHATLNPSKEQMDSIKERYSSRKVDFYSPANIYYATVLEMDKQLGLFMNKLEELGLKENTIVVFTSDNGPESIFSYNAAHSGVGSAGPFRGRKRSLYEGGIRVPFIISWPEKIRKDAVDATTVLTSVDFLHTLSKMANIEVSKEMEQDGEDMSKAFLEGPIKRQKSIYWECIYRVHQPMFNRSPMLAVRDGDWKLLMNPEGDRKELYNLAKDPREAFEASSEYPEKTEVLAGKLSKWYRGLPESKPYIEAGSNAYPWPQSSLIKEFPDRIKYLGIAIEEKKYFSWGASPVIGEDGKVHLFVARWPKKYGMQGWKTHSEIARYSSESPEGPFEFEEIVLQGTPEKSAPHNPNVAKVGKQYVLTHICNTEALSKNQKIYMMVADKVTGPWKQVNGNGLVLDVPKSDSVWCYKSRVGVNNPALLVTPEGKFNLYFKAIPTQDGFRQFGVAVSDKLEGPYQFEPKPVALSDRMIEDAYAFMYDNKYYLLSRTKKVPSMKGIDGLLWQSDNGVDFEQPTTGYFDLENYAPETLKIVNWIARDGQFERPQLLIMDGKPKYLYCAGPFNTEGRDVTCTYMFKIE